jgi:hypothetical protein
MSTPDFEKFLKQQPLRRAPAELRVKILDACHDASGAPAKGGRFAWLNLLLIPSRPAWGLLGLAWVVILMLRLSTPTQSGGTPVIAQRDAPVLAFPEQKNLLAEIWSIEPHPRVVPAPAHRPRTHAVRPRPLFV